MSLLQEIETFGLSDCEFNRKLLKMEELENKITELKEVLTWCNDMAYCDYLDELNALERELMELELLQLFRLNNGGV